MNFQKKLNNPIFKIVSKVSDRLNIPSFVVGGWVRDMILDRKEKLLILILYVLEAVLN